MKNPLRIAAVMSVLAYGANAAAHRAGGTMFVPPVHVSPNTAGLSARLVVGNTYVAFDPRFASITEPHGAHVPAGFPVAPPAIGVAIEVRNDSSQTLQVRWSGDDSPVTMTLHGRHVVAYRTTGACTEEFRVGAYTTLAPGASIRIPVHDLVSGDRCTRIAHYATTPGLYWLDVGMTAHVVVGSITQTAEMGQPVHLDVTGLPITVAR